jgi:UDP-N-acetylglucosamine 3-dehydrogenase
MSDTYKVLQLGLIGAGAWSWEVAGALSEMRGVRIAAVSNRTIEKAKALSEKFFIPRVFDTYKAVCEMPELDGVLVLTHESAHLEPTLLALAAGKGVFLEKPMADTAAAAREIAARARSSNQFLMPGHVLRFESRCRAAKERLTNAGAIRSIRCFQHRPKRSYATYCKPHIAFSVMVHHLDLCRWFAESRVVALESKERFHLGKDYPSSFWVKLEFENGCVGTLESGWVLDSDAPSFEEDGIEIVTERERIRMNWPSDGCEARHGSGVVRIDNSYGLALRFELEHWVSCIGKTKVSPVITPEEGAEAVALAEWAVATAKNHRT